MSSSDEAPVVTRKLHRSAGDAGLLAKSNAAVEAAIRDAGAGRRKYLLSQAPLFRKFLGVEDGDDDDDDDEKGKGKSKADNKAGGHKKRRMTEKEEDQKLLQDGGGVVFQPTRLEAQPANIMGKMRPYQVEGLNFLAALFERGINGILADEMGLGKTCVSCKSSFSHRHRISASLSS